MIFIALKTIKIIYIKYIIFAINLELYFFKFIIMNKSSFISSNQKENNYYYSHNVDMHYKANYNSSNFLNILKQKLIKKINKKIGKNLFHINSIYITGKAKFGNMIISINNAIIFCELLGCKKIIIQNNNNILINHKIFYHKYNITIEPNQLINDEDYLILDNWFFYFLNIKNFGNVNRLNILKKEILINLPQIRIHHDNLSIYIRSGDIFSVKKRSVYSYAQPPLCFYENILNTFKFRRVNIISINNLNPVIPILLKEYRYIKFNKHSIKYDIAYLINSFNIVSAKSSFVISIIKLNDNLKVLWEYDFYKLSEKFYHLHPSVYSFSYNYTIYKMAASLKYKNFMNPWINSKKQRKLMIKEKCKNNFTVIKPRI